MKCAGCRFYMVLGAKVGGNCHRFPTPKLGVDPSHWCGEYKAKEKPTQVDMFDAPKTKKGTRLTPEWELDAEIGKWAMAQGLTREEVLEIEQEFRDYWISESRAHAVKLDWDATWRNWVRREVKKKKQIAARNIK